MKRLLCTICLLLMIDAGGCATYWYQPGKSLEQCSQDFKQCDYEAAQGSYTPYGFGRSAISSGMQEGFQHSKLCEMCMQARGYQRLFKDRLPAAIRTYQSEAFIGVAGY